MSIEVLITASGYDVTIKLYQPHDINSIIIKHAVNVSNVYNVLCDCYAATSVGIDGR